MAVMDWGGANSRFLGLVSVWAARSFDQTALRPSVIKRIRQIDVKIHNTYHKLRCHCVNTSHCVNMHVWAPEVHSPLNSFGYWTLNKYYYYYYYYYYTTDSGDQGYDHGVVTDHDMETTVDRLQGQESNLDYNNKKVRKNDK